MLTLLGYGFEKATNHLIPPSYRILESAALLSAIATVAAAVFKNQNWTLVLAGTTALSFLGAYEIKRLALTKKEAEQINEYGQMIEKQKGQIATLEKEKEGLNNTLKTFQTDIASLKSENAKIDELTKKIETIAGDAESLAKYLNEQQENNKKLSTELGNQVQLIEKQKDTIKNLTTSEQKAAADLIDQTRQFELLVKEAKDEVARTQALADHYEADNKDLAKEKAAQQKLLDESKAQINELIKTSEGFQKEHAELAHENEQLKLNLKKRDEIETKLGQTIVNLENKVDHLESLVKEKHHEVETHKAEAEKHKAKVEKHKTIAKGFKERVLHLENETNKTTGT